MNHEAAKANGSVLDDAIKVPISTRKLTHIDIEAMDVDEWLWRKRKEDQTWKPKTWSS